ncbi:hypothetical protein BKA62DRAFT_739020 [Auriculariales sp. MPI-PUGE-AT-0066]|nr:hypothetical protein BKA62DRAFT_739020 [Auriculariales sp. MPI-PUGE-AT-0066]
MSYANVAAAHPPPPSLQGKPDPALLNTHPSHSYTLVVVAPPDFKSHPKVRIAFPFLERDPEIMVQTVTSEFDKAKRAYGRAEHEAETLLLRPGVAGGLLGLVNVGLLATASYSFYTDPALRRDRRAIGGTVVGALSYAKTEAGQREAQKAREEGAYVYRRAHDIVLVLAQRWHLGTIGYVFYSRPELRDDRRLIAGITTGVLTVFAERVSLRERRNVNLFEELTRL